MKIIVAASVPANKKKNPEGLLRDPHYNKKCFNFNIDFGVPPIQTGALGCRMKTTQKKIPATNRDVQFIK